MERIDMGKWIRRSVMFVLLAVFLGSIGMIIYMRMQYRVSERLYDQASKDYTDGIGGDDPGGEVEAAPITVDFEALQQVNKDTAGWIYCEDTVINYPVMHGGDDEYYLHHTYDGTYTASGSIFVESDNRKGFKDSNTIIYGHNMKDGSMFAALDEWSSQEFYEAHPVMWLLTPKQDYKIILFSGYTTSAYSDIYTIYPEPCREFNAYLDSVLEQSAFKADVKLKKKGHYVVLSTCAYVFDNARSVLHGMLEPVDSAGGIIKVEDEDSKSE